MTTSENISGEQQAIHKSCNLLAQRVVTEFQSIANWPHGKKRMHCTQACAGAELQRQEEWPPRLPSGPAAPPGGACRTFWSRGHSPSLTLAIPRHWRLNGIWERQTTGSAVPVIEGYSYNSIAYLRHMCWHLSCCRQEYVRTRRPLLRRQFHRPLRGYRRRRDLGIRDRRVRLLDHRSQKREGSEPAEFPNKKEASSSPPQSSEEKKRGKRVRCS